MVGACSIPACSACTLGGFVAKHIPQELQSTYS